MNPQQVIVLNPNDPDDGDVGRQQRGLAIAALARIEKNRIGYKVPSQSGSGAYVVNLDGEPFCTCPDFEKRQQPCKHIYAVRCPNSGLPSILYSIELTPILCPRTAR